MLSYIFIYLVAHYQVSVDGLNHSLHDCLLTLFVLLWAHIAPHFHCSRGSRYVACRHYYHLTATWIRYTVVDSSLIGSLHSAGKVTVINTLFFQRCQLHVNSKLHLLIVTHVRWELEVVAVGRSRITSIGVVSIHRRATVHTVVVDSCKVFMFNREVMRDTSLLSDLKKNNARSGCVPLVS